MQILGENKRLMESISILLPTRARPKLVLESLRNLENCYSSKMMEVIVYVDDCPETWENLKSSSFSQFKCFKLINGKKRIYSVKAFIEAFKASTSFWFAWMNDENSYRENWVVNAMHFFNQKFPDNVGVLSLYKKKKAGLGLSTKAFVKYNMMEWFYSGYTFYYPDDELTCRAILFGRYAWLEDSGVFHDIEKTDKFLTISIEERQALKKIDRGIFYKRTENNFNLPLDKIYEWNGFKNVNLPLKGSLE